MKSVLKPRFRQMMNVLDEMNESNSSINSNSKSNEEDIGDGWDGDSESVYEIAEEHLNTDEHLDIEEVKAQKKKKDSEGSDTD